MTRDHHKELFFSMRESNVQGKGTGWKQSDRFSDCKRLKLCRLRERQRNWGGGQLRGGRWENQTCFLCQILKWYICLLWHALSRILEICSSGQDVRTGELPRGWVGSKGAKAGEWYLPRFERLGQLISLWASGAMEESIKYRTLFSSTALTCTRGGGTSTLGRWMISSSLSSCASLFCQLCEEKDCA